MSLHYLGNREPPEIVFSVLLGICQDHRRRRIEMKFCIVTGLQQVVEVRILSKSVNRFRSCGGRNSPFSADLTIFSLIWPNHWVRANFDLSSETT